MKKMFVLLSLMFFFCSLNKVSAQKNINWKELQDFHAMISKTFHPTETGDLGPLKRNADKLAASAKAWAASPIPEGEGFNKELTSSTLAHLVALCDDLDRSVKAKASEDELKKKIGEVHDVFHSVVEKCRKPEHHEKEHEHHEKENEHHEKH